MRGYNIAQQIYLLLGVDPFKLETGHYREKSSQFSKKGPGRQHQQGKPAKKGDTP